MAAQAVLSAEELRQAVTEFVYSKNPRLKGYRLCLVVRVVNEGRTTYACKVQVGQRLIGVVVCNLISNRLVMDWHSY